MTSDRKLLWGGLGLLVVLFACCGGIVLGSNLSRDGASPAAPATAVVSPFTPMPTATASEPTPTNTLVVEPAATLPASLTPVVIVVTATPMPAAPTPTSVPPIQPTGAVNDFQALVEYAEAVKPILDEGLAAAERDGDILEASEEDPDILCGEGLTPNPVMADDAALMDDLVSRLNGIAPPAEAADTVHRPLVESARLWGDALDNINLSCRTEDAVARGLLRLEAVLQLGGSMLNFRIASDNFWRLAIANGLETIVGPSPLP